MPERKYRLVFLPLAEEGLTGIILYISRQIQNPTGAMHVMDRMRDAITKEAQHPNHFRNLSR